METATEIIEKVKEDICNNYCKIPGQYSPEEWEAKFMEICANCPLDRQYVMTSTL